MVARRWREPISDPTLHAYGVSRAFRPRAVGRRGVGALVSGVCAAAGDKVCGDCT